MVAVIPLPGSHISALLQSLVRGNLSSSLRFLPKRKISYGQRQYFRSESIGMKMSSQEILKQEETRRAISVIQENGDPYPRPQHELMFTPARSKIMSTKARIGVS